MADIACPQCGEPWDMDELHDVPGKSFTEAYHDFQVRGCEVFDSSHNSEPNTQRAAVASVLMDLLGDDVDGLAVELEDAEYFGYFRS
jgi:hypothetical protein